MNYRQKLLFSLVGALGLLVLIACQSPYGGPSVTVTHITGTIRLHVVPVPPTEFKLNKTGRLVCNAPKPEGCLKVPKGETAGITYTLTPKPGWYLSAVKICRATGVDPCKLGLPERADFAFTKDGTGAPAYPEANGELDLVVKLGADLQEFVIFDANIVPQDYTYTITACDGVKCTTADPPIENGGRR